MRLLHCLFLFSCIFCTLHTSAQLYWSINAGFVGNIGTSIRRIGVFASGSVANYGIMTSGRISLNYNTCSWGNKQASPEFQIGAGLIGGIKNSNPQLIKQWDIATSNGYHVWSISYVRNWYFDKLGCSQRSGTIGFQCKNIYITTENDIFGRHRSDAFRTAAAVIQYRKNDFAAGIKLILWTGDSFNHKAITYENTNYKARFGYKDISETPWGRQSLGILALEIGYMLPYQQAARFAVGADAEEIRHLFQNRFIHDAYFIPRSWIHYKNYHYPKLDVNGCPVIDSNQVVRPARLFINTSINENLFY